MKKIKKNELISLRAFFNALNIVGLAPAKAKAVMAIYRKVKELVAEIDQMQQDLLTKYEIKVLDGNKLDQSSENFKAYADTFNAILDEVVDFTDYCTLTEDEALVALSKVDAPMVVIDTLAEFLTAEPVEEIKEEIC